jgi:hypothetical protein
MPRNAKGTPGGLPAATIDPVQAVAYGIGGWIARGLRTGEFGRASLNGFALGAVNDLVFQTAFSEVKSLKGNESKRNRELMAIAAGAISTWVIDKLLVPETKKQISAQEAVVDSIVGNKVGDILVETIDLAPVEPELP